MVTATAPRTEARLPARPGHASSPIGPTVCQVLHSLNVGGAEMLAYELAVGLADRFRFAFACLDEVGPLGMDLRQKGYSVVHLGRKAGFDAGCARRLAAFVRECGASLIHAHQYTPF